MEAQHLAHSFRWGLHAAIVMIMWQHTHWSVAFLITTTVLSFEVFVYQMHLFFEHYDATHRVDTNV